MLAGRSVPMYHRRFAKANGGFFVFTKTRGGQVILWYTMRMNFFDAAVLGLIEGLTEFLPVSSTGHLILAGHLLGIPDTDFLKTFEIAIQAGAIGAGIVLSWKSFLNLEITKRVLVGFVPTALIGFALYRLIKTYLLGNEYVVLAALAVGGVALIVFERLHKESAEATDDISRMSYGQAVGIGLFQSIAVIPGVSRSGASILGGLLLGLRRTATVEYSFLLAVPTMGAATALDLFKSYALFSAGDALALVVGFVTAFVVALVVIQFFLRFVRTQTFISFGVYRVLAAAAFFLFLM